MATPCPEHAVHFSSQPAEVLWKNPVLHSNAHDGVVKVAFRGGDPHDAAHAKSHPAKSASPTHAPSLIRRDNPTSHLHFSTPYAFVFHVDVNSGHNSQYPDTAYDPISHGGMVRSMFASHVPLDLNINLFVAWQVQVCVVCPTCDSCTPRFLIKTRPDPPTPAVPE